jgi:mercuric ion transport protein
MQNKTLLKTGLIGSVIAALCCATPVLAIVLGAVGLGIWTTHLDSVLLPALGLFLLLTLVALWRVRREATSCSVRNTATEESDP